MWGIFKTILFLNDREVRGHNLSSLFRKIPSSIRNSIISDFDKQKKTTKLFEDLIEKYSNAFQEWRYLYENNNEDILFDISNMFLIANILINY